MFEEWRDIKGYKDYYQISSTGKVRSLDRKIKNNNPQGIYTRIFPGKVLKSFSDKNGYQYVSLSKEGKTKRACVHVLVLESFVGKRPKGKDCNHLNGRKDDNQIGNLEYCTRGENLLHSYRTLGRAVGGTKGEKHHKSKLTNRDIVKIRNLYSSGKYTQKQLANMFSVAQTNISNVVRKTGWKHID